MRSLTLEHLKEVEVQGAPPKLMTATEVADYLGVTVTAIYGWRYKKEGPRGYRLGNGRVRYRREDVEAWLEDQADKPKVTS
jgi:excisionase family DNA binding protein